jgi:ubiquinol oxidase
LHRETKTISDKLAYGLVKLARTIFDFVSGYKHVEGPPDPKMTIAELRKAGYLLDDKQWLTVSAISEYPLDLSRLTSLTF